VADHGDVDQDKASLGRAWIETMFKGTDEAEIGILHSLLGVLQSIIEERIRASILHERFETGAEHDLSAEGQDGIEPESIHFGNLDDRDSDDPR
jgi:hypothetical protein